ncbi:hypothetical protein KC343_g13628 [Hortaea werneckii]|nr:hypothetical protein KC323_g7414 [Hortaea werneckii]KAI7178527.1 hypothetical protein KC352_g23898 [Hortaea werneckii]KAI7351610.1 hypothetical protein KC320_g4841 [Hortaea werneckii]KAI7551392.1 hypothetical protein KC317_g14019 [Hortaea werneckii]KAI7601055.1 hypothetical protein KC346_g12992 [Hortaea werneckii]
MLLPEDILLHAFSYFQRSFPGEDSSEANEDSIRQATLAALSRSSRLFHILVNPLLYGTIDLRRHTSRRLRSLTKTVAGDNHLAGLIRAINTEVLDSPPKSPSYGRDELTNAPHHGYQEPMKEDPSPLNVTIQNILLPPELERSIIKGAAANSDNALMALLLALCHNLETFQFRARPGIERSATMQLISSATTTSLQFPRSPILLPSLRHVIIWHQPYSSDPIPFSAVSPFLTLPSIRTFEGDLLSCTRRTVIPHNTQETQPAHPSPLQTLTLTNTFLDGPGLESLLTACPNIQALSVHFADLCCEQLCSHAAIEDGGSYTRFVRSGEVFRQRRPAQLRKLALELDGNHFLDSRGGGDEDGVPGIGDLRCLEGLEELTLPGMALCGIRPRTESEDARGGFCDLDGIGDRLPRGLRKLDVILDEDRDEDDEEALSGALARLGGIWLGDRLESICIDGVEIWPE